MAMGNQGKKIVTELVVAFVLLLLLVVLRPMFVGQVEQASQPYTITYTNSTGATVTKTITPDSTISSTQANTIYSIVIFLVALISLIVILLTVAGKI